VRYVTSACFDGVAFPSTAVAFPPALDNVSRLYGGAWRRSIPISEVEGAA